MRNLVIAIGREFGSGGKEIGQKLADRLNIKCYDSELLSIAAKNSGFCEEILKKNDEKPLFIFFSHGYIFHEWIHISPVCRYAIEP